MILLANGCSWTYGGGLGLDSDEDTSKRLEVTWPNQLGKLVNAEKTINLAAGCGSNQRVVRTTFDYLSSQPSEDLQKTIAIIQWTELSRYEFYYPYDINDLAENHQDRWARAKIGCVLNSYQHDERESKKYNDLRLSTYTDIEGMYRFISEALALENILTYYKIPYYYWTYDKNFLENFPPDIGIFLKQKFNWLNTSDAGIWDYDRVSDNDDHPSIAGHKQIASYIANFLVK